MGLCYHFILFHYNRILWISFQAMGYLSGNKQLLPFSQYCPHKAFQLPWKEQEKIPPDIFLLLNSFMKKKHAKIWEKEGKERGEVECFVCSVWGFFFFNQIALLVSSFSALGLNSIIALSPVDDRDEWTLFGIWWLPPQCWVFSYCLLFQYPFLKHEAKRKDVLLISLDTEEWLRPGGPRKHWRVWIYCQEEHITGM